MTRITPHSRYPGVYEYFRRGRSTPTLATRNLSPGIRVYSERLIEEEGTEYRLWDPNKSKLAAALLKGLPALPLQDGQRVLYLGAASGTTVSHVSDLVGHTGGVYCVDFAHRPLRDLVIKVANVRKNIFPILGDARFPTSYRGLLERVDGIYCDIAQPEQAKILADNAALFLREEGWALLAVKAMSIDSTGEPLKIYAREAEQLRRRGFAVTRVVQLRPFDKAHAMVSAVRTL
jgi:fibrillarin-like pre-rRNA processing protein